MSTRGRKADLKVIEGGLKEEPAVPAHIPPEMVGEWRAVIDDLVARQLLTDAMLGTVEAYIRALQNARAAQDQIGAHGVMIRTEKGVLQKNPAITLLNKCESSIQRLSAELGLTPASRSRKKMQPAEGGDGAQQYGLFDV